MSNREYLGELELLVLSAVSHLDGEAYGVSIRGEIERRTGRDPAIGAVYSSLVRLEAKGFVRFTQSDPLPVQGGRSRKHAHLTAAGSRELRSTTEALANMLGLRLRPNS